MLTCRMNRGTAWLGVYTMYSGTRTPRSEAGTETESKDACGLQASSTRTRAPSIGAADGRRIRSGLRLLQPRP